MYTQSLELPLTRKLGTAIAQGKIILGPSFMHVVTIALIFSNVFLLKNPKAIKPMLQGQIIAIGFLKTFDDVSKYLSSLGVRFIYWIII